MSIPRKDRGKLEQSSEGPPILTHHAECLELFPYEDWCELEDRLLGMSGTLGFDPNVQSLIRFKISGAQDCPIDKQGRILIPKTLRDFAGLDREVAVVGVGNHLQLWNKARFDADVRSTQARLSEIESAVAAMGNKE
ncbi:division/cell wall cluster transcriptional repressor MraZ [Myxococcota bacterium]|nr:division/cell wall cluster transcriptional repressor MraZ [Myxococcota bacterium]